MSINSLFRASDVSCMLSYTRRDPVHKGVALDRSRSRDTYEMLVCGESRASAERHRNKESGSHWRYACQIALLCHLKPEPQRLETGGGDSFCEAEAYRRAIQCYPLQMRAPRMSAPIQARSLRSINMNSPSSPHDESSPLIPFQTSNPICAPDHPTAQTSQQTAIRGGGIWSRILTLGGRRRIWSRLQSSPMTE